MGARNYKRTSTVQLLKLAVKVLPSGPLSNEIASRADFLHAMRIEHAKGGAGRGFTDRLIHEIVRHLDEPYVTDRQREGW
jgi:hypothetical protein